MAKVNAQVPSKQKIITYLLTLPDSDYSVRDLEEAVRAHFELGVCTFIINRGLIKECIENLPYFFWERCARLPNGKIFISQNNSE